MATSTAPSNAQVRWLKNLGFSQAQIDGMDRRAAAAAIEEHKDDGRKASPAVDAVIREAAGRPSLADPGNRVWRQMLAFHLHWAGCRFYTDQEAATLAVEYFDVHVEHPKCWPAEIHDALDGVDLDRLRADLAAEIVKG